MFFFSHPLVFIQPLSKSAGGEAGERGVGNGENWIWGDKGGWGVYLGTESIQTMSHYKMSILKARLNSAAKVESLL